MSSKIYKCFVWDNCGATFLGRIRGNTGALITQAALTSITRTVFDEDNAGAVVIGPTALTIANVVFDSLQAAANDLILWTRDTTGYNFKDAVPATAFPLGTKGTTLQRRYTVEYVFDPTSGENFPLVFAPIARNLRSSAG